jgi:N-acetyl-gamma-glutamylphosphate reductase
LNYKKHYEALIERAKSRLVIGLVERHHILPRCMGGGDDAENIAILTPEEHYVAHQLLVKIHPDVRGLVHAAMKMSKQCTGNKAYGWLRNRHSEIVRAHRHSPEIRERISKGLVGKKRPPRTQEHRDRLREARKNLTPEQRARIGAAGKGRKHSEETKAKLSTERKGIKKSAETRLKMSLAAMGNKKALGHRHTPEAMAKMSLAKRMRDAERKAKNEANL